MEVFGTVAVKGTLPVVLETNVSCLVRISNQAMGQGSCRSSRCGSMGGEVRALGGDQLNCGKKAVSTLLSPIWWLVGVGQGGVCVNRCIIISRRWACRQKGSSEWKINTGSSATVCHLTRRRKMRRRWKNICSAIRNCRMHFVVCFFPCSSPPPTPPALSPPISH